MLRLPALCVRIMQRCSRVCTLIIAVIINQAGHAELPPPPSNQELIPTGSLIIAMDNDKQNVGVAFNLKAYGLVNHLLWNDVPVKWAIRSGKLKDGIDFSVTAERILPGATVASSLAFRAGPFIIHKDWVSTALPFITAFGNSVAVYRTTGDVTVDIRQTIAQRKKVGVLDDGGKANIHTAILEAAGFVSGTQYLVIPAATLATVNADICITLASEPHWKTTSNDTEAEAIRAFAESGGNFLAQCAAIESYENNTTFGLFQTSAGIIKEKISGGFNYPEADLEYSQIHGDLKDRGGSLSEFNLATGSSFINGAHSLVNNLSDSDIHVATASRLTSGPGSMVYYLGGHEYKKSDIEELNGRRMYLNAVMAEADRPTICGFSVPLTPPIPDIIMLKSALTLTDPVNGASNPKALPGAAVLYSIRMTNVGRGNTDNDSVVLTETLPTETMMYVNDLNGPGSGPVIFVDGTPNSGLSYSFLGLSDLTDDLEFDDGSLNFTYTPTPDGNGYDTNVTGVRVNPGGPLVYSDLGDPYFELRLQTKIR